MELQATVSAMEARSDIEGFSTQELIDTYLPLVRSVASGIIARCPANVELDDLINVGVIGLMDAAERYQPVYGKPFKCYAELRIRGEILDELRHNDWVPRSTRRRLDQISRTRQSLEKERGPSVSDREVAAAMGVKLETYHRMKSRTSSGTFLRVEDLGLQEDDHRDLMEALRGDTPDPDMMLRMHEVEELLSKAIAELPHRERITIYLYYFQELSQKEIGRVLGVTESRVSQMHTKALALLKRKVARDFAECA